MPVISVVGVRYPASAVANGYNLIM